jgi:glycosyltransferase involved in cell wall biosynthesis
VEVVANAAEPPLEPLGPSRGRRTILFSGPFRYEPNLAGIIEFLKTVYPRLLAEVPDVCLRVLGGDQAIAMAKRHECFSQRGVEVCGYTSDMQAHLRTCALTVNPLANVRGSSIKLAESLAAGRVCVTTAAGARGFRGLKANSLIIVPEVRDMFEPVRDLLLDEGRRLREEIPSESLLQQLSWRNSARMQAALYKGILSRPC